MSAVALLKVRTSKNVIAVPASAVFRADGRDQVWVVEDGVAVERVVRLGAEGSDTIAIVSGLEKGETEVYVVNFANADMVGHTGIFDAVLKAVQKVDECLQRVVAAVKARGGTIAVTSPGIGGGARFTVRLRQA